MDPLKNCKAAIQDAFENMMKVVAQQEELLRVNLENAQDQSQKAEAERKHWEMQSQMAEQKAKDADQRLQVMDDLLKEMRELKSQVTRAPEVNVPMPEKPQPPFRPEASSSSLGGIDPSWGIQGAPPEKPQGNFKAPPDALQAKHQRKASPWTPGPDLAGPPGLQAQPKEEGPLKRPPPAPPGGQAQDWFAQNPRESAENGTNDGRPAKFKAPPSPAGPAGFDAAGMPGPGGQPKAKFPPTPGKGPWKSPPAPPPSQWETSPQAPRPDRSEQHPQDPPNLPHGHY